MTLYEECLIALKNEYHVIYDDKKEILEEVFTKFPLSISGSIDWGKSKVIAKGYYSEEIFEYLKNRYSENSDVLIIWDNGELPVLQTKILSALGVIDDIEAVSFDTRFYLPEFGELIEVHHEGCITLGKSLLE